MRIIFNKEVEYKKVLHFYIKWAKHWTANSTRNTSGMNKQSKETLEFINCIQEKEIAFKEKNELLSEFFYNNYKKAQESMDFSSYYHDCYNGIRSFITDIENEKTIKIPKVSRR